MGGGGTMGKAFAGRGKLLLEGEISRSYEALHCLQSAHSALYHLGQYHCVTDSVLNTSLPHIC